MRGYGVTGNVGTEKGGKGQRGSWQRNGGWVRLVRRDGKRARRALQKRKGERDGLDGSGGKRGRVRRRRRDEWGGGVSERREHRRERIRAQGIHVALEVQRTRVERGRCFLVGGPSRRERQVRSGGEGGYRERPQGYKASLIIFCRPHDRGARLPGMTEIE